MRIFLGIASSEYEDTNHLLPLEGTIADGRNIEAALSNNVLGEYNTDLSKLLISPTLSEVQNAIRELLFTGERAKCFTLYFAGHGISHRGAYYLCLRDTYTDKLSATALPLNHVFNVINDALPLQTNIIIDACEAGGMSGDLTTLIKPEVFGDASSPSVSLFGSCMRNQGAGEDDSGGYATQRLLEYLTGKIAIDTRWPFLDLVQIGRNVSADMEGAGYDQTPVVWGLNLTGIPTFSKNPHYAPTTGTAPITMDMYTLIPSDLDLIQEEKERMWLQYLQVSKTGATPSIVKSLVRCVKSLKEKGLTPIKISSFLLGAAESLSMRVAEREDAFSEIEVLASCGAAFLPIIEDPNAEQSFLALLDRILQNAVPLFETLEDDLNEYHTLLSSHSGLNDLYMLPVRVSKVLGWMALIKKIEVTLGANQVIPTERVIAILDKIAEHYVASFVCVSDQQAPYLWLYSQMEGIEEQNESFLLPIRCYLNDFIENKGQITIPNISGEDVLNYLISRESNNYTSVRDVLSHPSELLPVLLVSAAASSMDEEIDPYMKKIDHMPFNFFLVEDVTTFANERIDNGTNITMQIGSELGAGVFTLEDFRQNFSNICVPRIQASRDGKKPETIIAMALASFMLPDRVSWATLDAK